MFCPLCLKCQPLQSKRLLRQHRVSCSLSKPTDTGMDGEASSTAQNIPSAAIMKRNFMPPPAPTYSASPVPQPPTLSCLQTHGQATRSTVLAEPPPRSRPLATILHAIMRMRVYAQRSHVCPIFVAHIGSPERQDQSAPLGPLRGEVRSTALSLGETAEPPCVEPSPQAV